MNTVKPKVIYLLLVAAVVLGMLFGVVIQKWPLLTASRAAPLEPAALSTFIPTPAILAMADSQVTLPLQLNGGPNDPAKLQRATVQVEVRAEVQATGGGRAEANAVGPGDTRAKVNTDGPGAAQAVAYAAAPEGIPLPLPATGAAMTQNNDQNNNGVLASQLSGGIPAGSPRAIVNSEVVNVRFSPSINAGVLDLTTRGQQYNVVARTSDNSWWQICCINNQRGWIVGQFLDVLGSTTQLETVELPARPIAELQPTPTIVPTLAPTPIPTPGFDFNLVTQEQFEETILPRIYMYVLGGSEALSGYKARVKKDGLELPTNLFTFGPQVQHTWGVDGPRQRLHNLKLEFPTVLGSGTWEVQLLDATGREVGPPAVFHLKEKEQYQEMYVRYERR